MESPTKKHKQKKNNINFTPTPSSSSSTSASSSTFFPSSSSNSSTSSSSSSTSIQHLAHSLSHTDLCHPDNAVLVSELKKLLLSVKTEEHEHVSSSFLGHLNDTDTAHKAVTTMNACCAGGSCSYDFQRVVFSSLYLMVVLFITAYVMAVVHDRVPDKTTYPPLPDLALDNLPHIHWAFEVAELMIVTMFLIFAVILLFHRYRWIIFRRFCAITGSVFLLRCVTMLVTSLSVPGQHLECDVSVGSTHEEKLLHAWKIISHMALSVSGVRTCGDYMFSGHTVVLTILNYFINDYTPSTYKGLHIFSWILNCFGMFFILAGHEHYSIDVFIAYYISSRLFFYYHSLANSHAIKRLDVRDHVQGFFPLFSYLEECTTGTIPNTYEWPWEAVKRAFSYLSQSISSSSKKKT